MKKQNLLFALYFATVIFFIGISSKALADTTTFTEDFSSTTYYDSDASDAFTTWESGAQLMFDTTTETFTAVDMSSYGIYLINEIAVDTPNLLLTGTSNTGSGRLVTAGAALASGVLTLTATDTETISSSIQPRYLATDGTYYYTNSLNTANATRRFDAWTIDIGAGSITNVANTTVDSSLNGDIVAFSNNLWAGNIYLGLIQIDTSALNSQLLGTQLYNKQSLYHVV